MLKRFHEIFGIQDTLEEEKYRFVQRINETIFGHIQKLTNPTHYRDILQEVCYELGISYQDIMWKANQGAFRPVIPQLRVLTKDDFLMTLKVLAILYQVLSIHQAESKIISRAVYIAMDRSTIDLGIR
jgi:hypothetical protein